jgi:hypothetical protein
VEALLSFFKSWAESGPCCLRVLDGRVRGRLSDFSELNRSPSRNGQGADYPLMLLGSMD